jgi:hypothetical protein
MLRVFDFNSNNFKIHVCLPQFFEEKWSFLSKIINTIITLNFWISLKELFSKLWLPCENDMLELIKGQTTITRFIISLQENVVFLELNFLERLQLIPLIIGVFKFLKQIKAKNLEFFESCAEVWLFDDIFFNYACAWVKLSFVKCNYVILILFIAIKFEYLFI